MTKLDEFKKERTVIEIDLVYTIEEMLKSSVSKEAAATFSNNESIKAIRSKDHKVQVIIINKWFSELFLIARSLNSNLRVDDVLFALVNGEAVSDWVKLYGAIIVPFIKKNSILL